MQPRAWAGRIAAMAAENASVADALMRKNVYRLRIAMVVGAAVNVLCILAFWQPAPGADAVVAEWRSQIMQVHAIKLMASLTLLALAQWRLTQPAHRPTDTALVLLTVALEMAFCAALTVVDQKVTTHIIPIVVGAIAVSTFMLLRPGHALVLFSAVGVAVAALLQAVQPDTPARLSNQVNLLACMGICVAVSTQMWRTMTRARLLRLQVEARNAELEQQRTALDHLARHDELTGLMNRREFMAQAQDELLRAQRRSAPTACLLIDLDHFKRVNDTHGHPVGDAALRHAALVLQAQLRRTDLLGRLGGEEFMALLPDTHAADALPVAEKLRLGLHDTPMAVDGQPLLMTASVGVVVVDSADVLGAQAFYQRADQALYRAKSLGRNRVELWQVPSVDAATPIHGTAPQADVQLTA